MMYLLDTNVVSELRKAQTSKLDKNVQAWFDTALVADLFLSAVTVLELEIGILLIERRDAAQATVLRSWVDKYLLPAFSGRILNVDATVARRCARLHVPNPCSERDAMIAATALVHAMVVITRNVADFKSTGVKILNPWDELSVQ